MFDSGVKLSVLEFKAQPAIFALDNESFKDGFRCESKPGETTGTGFGQSECCARFAYPWGSTQDKNASLNDMVITQEHGTSGGAIEFRLALANGFNRGGLNTQGSL